MTNSNPPKDTEGVKALGHKADNRYELAMLGGKKKAYTEILAHFANGESPSHIVAVLRHEVKKLDKKLGRKQ